MIILILPWDICLVAISYTPCKFFVQVTIHAKKTLSSLFFLHPFALTVLLVEFYLSTVRNACERKRLNDSLQYMYFRWISIDKPFNAMKSNCQMSVGFLKLPTKIIIIYDLAQSSPTYVRDNQLAIRWNLFADAKFWVGAGPSPSPQGIRVPDENGKEQPLRRYDRKAIVLTLPGDLTIHQIGHFGVWCEAFTVDFGHVQIPQGLNVPPSLKMLGVSPQVSWKGFL